MKINKKNQINIVYFYADDENNKKIYAFHRNHGNRYEIRYKDRKCLYIA